MLKSSIVNENGAPALFVDGHRETAIGYTTYFEERSRYEDFISAGYRIFFVNASFTAAPINNFTGFSPFRKGIFEDPERSDYSEFEDAIYKILKKCPDAVIFPRINISMPKWWTDSHPIDVVPTLKGGYREALFSEAFRKDGTELLKRTVRHICSSNYAHRIGGWQLCGGLTQEWFHHDNHGSLGDAAKAPYKRWVKDSFGIDNAELPDSEDYVYKGSPRQSSKNAQRYALFCNIETAKTLEIFAKAVKEETHHEQVVGAFYGYAYQSNGTPLFGTHGMRALLDSEHLDFFSAPNAYSNGRKFGIDWADMIPVDSIKLHGKLPYIECDIRTYLTTGVGRARPGEYPEDIYTDAVWSGPASAELSRLALRKCFCHQLTKASAIWWFDMWGGWYDDPLLMKELSDMKKIFDDNAEKKSKSLSSEVIFFADETAFSELLIDSPQIKAVSQTRTNMGNIGTPYDTFMVEDAPYILKKYKAAVFPMPFPSEAGIQAMKLCEENGIPYITASEDRLILTSDDIRVFLIQNGIHIYTEGTDVVYIGNGYAALHSATEGKKTLMLPTVYNVTPVFGADIPQQSTNRIEFTLKENGTALFRIVPND